MRVTLGSTRTCGNTGGNSPSASSSAPAATYIVGRVGRDLAAGSQVQLQQIESKQPGGRPVLSAGLPWGTFRGVADENYWLLVEDDRGARIIPAPFVAFKSTGPEDTEYDISEVENRIERRRQTFREEDKRARKRHFVKGRTAERPLEIELRSGDSDSDPDVAGAVKALRKGDDEWDARDDEANIFADDEVSVQEWSDNDASGAPEEDADMDHIEFATAEEAGDALDEHGREIERLLKTGLDGAPTPGKRERSIGQPSAGPQSRSTTKRRAASLHADPSDKGPESQGPRRRKTGSSTASCVPGKNGKASDRVPLDLSSAACGVANAAVPSVATPPKKRLRVSEKCGAATTGAENAATASSLAVTAQQQVQRRPQVEDIVIKPSLLAEDGGIATTKTRDDTRKSHKSARPVENHEENPEMMFDRDDILKRINTVLDRPDACTLQAVMAEFNLTQTGSPYYEAVATELKAVAKLKRGGLLVRRNQRRT